MAAAKRKSGPGDSPRCIANTESLTRHEKILDEKVIPLCRDNEKNVAVMIEHVGTINGSVDKINDRMEKIEAFIQEIHNERIAQKSTKALITKSLAFIGQALVHAGLLLGILWQLKMIFNWSPF